MTPSLKIFIPFIFLFFILTGCKGSFSTLDPAGDSAQIIADLFWWMLGGGVLIWLIFLSILLYTLLRPHPHNAGTTAFFIIGGGIVFPVVILCTLLYFSLAPLPVLLKPAPKGSLVVEVSAAQWWWRVQYHRPDGSRIELANEIRLPVNEPVQFHLTSVDVIHSFWIPSLGGKMDMIPGHKTMLTLRPSKIGSFGGVCAEFCGTSHALMKLKVLVMEKNNFLKWLEGQQASVTTPTSALAMDGLKSFKKNGCLACHTVRGVGEFGVLGPDLTHVGSRLSIGAGILPNTKASLHSWISRTHKIKPGVNMPSFSMLPDEEVQAIAGWLKGLK